MLKGGAIGENARAGAAVDPQHRIAPSGPCPRPTWAVTNSRSIGNQSLTRTVARAMSSGSLVEKMETYVEMTNASPRRTLRSTAARVARSST
jgi:hypothetical protein